MLCRLLLACQTLRDYFYLSGFGHSVCLSGTLFLSHFQITFSTERIGLKLLTIHKREIILIYSYQSFCRFSVQNYNFLTRCLQVTDVLHGALHSRLGIYYSDIKMESKLIDNDLVFKNEHFVC